MPGKITVRVGNNVKTYLRGYRVEDSTHLQVRGVIFPSSSNYTNNSKCDALILFGKRTEFEPDAFNYCKTQRQAARFSDDCSPLLRFWHRSGLLAQAISEEPVPILEYYQNVVMSQQQPTCLYRWHLSPTTPNICCDLRASLKHLLRTSPSREFPYPTSYVTKPLTQGTLPSCKVPSHRKSPCIDAT